MSESIKLSSRETREFWEIPVLFEDDHLLALEKPTGLLTSPDRHEIQRPSLTKLLHTGIAEGKPWASNRRLSYLAVAHRLDFETSGVLLLAKSKEILIKLADLFGSALVNHEFVALVQGRPETASFEVEAALTPHPTLPHLMHVDRKRGKKSRTSFVSIESFPGWTLLRCELVTGRTHQVRVHLRSAGLPIVADALYGGKPLRLSRLKPNYRPKPGMPERPLISCLALHATELSLNHPATGARLVINSPIRKDLKVGLKYLRLCAGPGKA